MYSRAIGFPEVEISTICSTHSLSAIVVQSSLCLKNVTSTHHLYKTALSKPANSPLWSANKTGLNRSVTGLCMPSAGQNWTNFSKPVTALVAPWNPNVSDEKMICLSMKHSWRKLFFPLLFIVFFLIFSRIQDTSMCKCKGKQYHIVIHNDICIIKQYAS